MAVDFSKLRESINGLLNSNTSKEDIDKISSISKNVDNLELEVNKKDSDYESLKNDYIELIKNTGFKGTESRIIDEERSPRTLEEIANDIIKNRK